MKWTKFAEDIPLYRGLNLRNVDVGYLKNGLSIQHVQMKFQEAVHAVLSQPRVIFR